MCPFAGLGLDCLARQVVWIDNKLAVEWWWLKGHAVDKRTGRMGQQSMCETAVRSVYVMDLCLSTLVPIFGRNVPYSLRPTTSQLPHAMYKLLRRPPRAFIIL